MRKFLKMSTILKNLVPVCNLKGSIYTNTGITFSLEQHDNFIGEDNKDPQNMEVKQCSGQFQICKANINEEMLKLTANYIKLNPS